MGEVSESGTARPLIAYYLDENLSEALARAVRRFGIDIVSSHQSGHDGESDSTQLDIAARLGRCLVTNDVDFVSLAVEFEAKGGRHFGILLLSDRLHPDPHNYGAIARALAHYSAMFPDGISHTDYLHPAPDDDDGA